MSFIVDQGKSFTTDDDEHYQVKGTGVGGLNKWQYTAHVFIYAGDSEETAQDKYIYLICRGSETRISR